MIYYRKIKFPTFTNYKISITLLFFQNVVERRCHSDCKFSQNI